MRTRLLGVQVLPGINCTMALGLRMPALPDSVPPMPRMGSSSSLPDHVVTEVAAFGAQQWSIRVDGDSSVAAPTSSAISMRNVCATCTVMPCRTYFLKPGNSTDN